MNTTITINTTGDIGRGKILPSERRIDEDDRETNAGEFVADKRTLNFENDVIEQLDKQVLLSTLSEADKKIIDL